MVLRDIGVPLCGGPETTRRVLAEMPDMKIVVVTVFDDDEDLFDGDQAEARPRTLPAPVQRPRPGGWGPADRRTVSLNACPVSSRRTRSAVHGSLDHLPNQPKEQA